MIEELIKEEASAFADLNLIINSPPSIEKIDFSEFETISDASFKLLLKDLVERSGAALKECQLIESLDCQLRRLNEAQNFLEKLNRLKQLNESIMEYKEEEKENDLEGLVEMVLEWRREYRNDTKLLAASQGSETVCEFIDKGIPEIIDEEIERVLKGWTDDPDRIDDETVALLSNQLHLDPSTNPLHGLFSTYPSRPLKPLLNHHSRLGNTKRIAQMFPERLLNRFYDILQGKKSVPPFSVGLIEEMVPEKMKYASRISCILEATAFFLILHGDLTEVLFNKCGQIIKQIRKCAREERKWVADKDASPAALDAQLNEISLINNTLKDFLRLHPETGSSDILVTEKDKWTAVYSETEAIYLQKGIKRAIEMDQIVTGGEGSEFPVSSCVDDIFYVLQAAKKRSERILVDPLAFIANAFNDYFLHVLKTHLAASINQLKPLQNIFESHPANNNINTSSNNTNNSNQFKPSRELISTLVLINNLVATQSYWHTFTSPASDHLSDGDEQSEPVKTVTNELKKTFDWAVGEGLYVRILQPPIRKEFNACKTIETLFSKFQSTLLIINSLFKAILAKNALNELLLAATGEFNQMFCKQLLSDQPAVASNSDESTAYLRYDRLLHELIRSGEEEFGGLPGLEIRLSRAQQAVSILLCESRAEGQEMVDEWKTEEICALRAGEILLLLNKKHK